MASASLSQTTAMTSFQFDGRNVRVVMKDGEPWFVAHDVAAELGYDEANRLTRLLDDDEKAPHIVGTVSGDQQATVISEPGLFRAMLQRRSSKKLTPAKREAISRFQRWVLHDVLPTIRRTGAYGTAPAPQFAIPKTMAEALRLAADQSEQIVAMEAERQANVPKVEAFDHFIGSRSENVGLRVGMAMVGAYTDKGIKHLRDTGVLYGHPATPYKRYRDLGYFSVDPATDRHDREKVRPQTHLTPKGLDWLRRTLPDRLFRVPPTRQLNLLDKSDRGHPLPN